MNKPTDYPLQPDQAQTVLDSTATEVTYAVLKDRVEAKQPVTDEMIRMARATLETAHTTSTKNTNTEQNASKLSNIRSRFRQS